MFKLLLSALFIVGVFSKAEIETEENVLVLTKVRLRFLKMGKPVRFYSPNRKICSCTFASSYTLVYLHFFWFWSLNLVENVILVKNFLNLILLTLSF